MIVKNAVFVKSVGADRKYFNEDLPEIAVVGKSNVGKSSLINMLASNSGLARTSKQPGKTRVLNYFLINREFYLVDLPGYGFARVSDREKEEWAALMADYFSSARNLKAVIVLIDIRREPSADDKNMVQLLEYYSIPYIVAATKADKIAKSKRKNMCAGIKRALPSSYDYTVLPVSNEDGYGKDGLLAEMERKLNA